MKKRAYVTSGWAAALFVSLAAIGARADEPGPKAMSKWAIDVAHPDQNIPAEKDRDADPIQFGYWLQDVTAKAVAASRSGDHVTAARLYEALAQAVPDRAVGLVKACEEYEAMGDSPKAIDTCGRALVRDGLRVGDYTRFVELMLAKPGELTEKDQAALAQVLGHMREEPAGREVVDELECQVGARTQNVSQLEECTTNLTARAPDDVKTITYVWALAVAEKRFDAARAEIARARAAGVPGEPLAAMERTTTESQWSARGRLALDVIGALVALGLMAFAALRASRMIRTARPA